LAVAPTRGRATRVEGTTPPEAEATRALFEQYAGQIFRYCLHQLGSREEAEDAVQSTFLNAFRGLERGVVPELESAWLFKIAHNVCLSRRRSSWRRGRIEAPADFDVVEEIAPAPARVADELIGLQDVLEQMPENQRRAILLREWQGLSYREIAAELELSQTAVETLIFRARRSLAAGLEQPPERRRRRALRALDGGNVLAALKSLLFGGGVAAKLAATAAVVGVTAVAVATPLPHHQAKLLPAGPRASGAHPVQVSARTSGDPVQPAASAVTADRGEKAPAGLRAHSNRASSSRSGGASASAPGRNRVPNGHGAAVAAKPASPQQTGKALGQAKKPAHRHPVRKHAAKPHPAPSASAGVTGPPAGKGGKPGS
jgi:RNA polymerase sigma factor (sigma-70 family)